MNFFIDRRRGFIFPRFPDILEDARINEIESLAEVMRTAIWGRDPNNLVVRDVTDSMCSDMWITARKERRGAGMQITRKCRIFPIRRAFRMFSFYCRSGRNIAAYFLPIAKEGEISHWVAETI